MKIKLVMFDFDGTLVDTAPDIITATNLLLTKHQKPNLPPDAIRAEIGTGLKTLISDIFPESIHNAQVMKTLMDDFIGLYLEHILDSPRFFEGAWEFLTGYAVENDLQIAIVSNKRESMIHPILKHLKADGLPWVEIIGGDTLSTMKPHPAPMLRAIESAGVLPEEAVIVGDGTPDIEGAKATGCHSIAVDFGYGSISELMSLGADLRISGFAKLPQALSDLSD